MSRAQGWWQTLSAQQLADLHALLTDPDNTYTEIGQVYTKKANDVAYYAQKIGAPPRSRFSHARKATVIPAPKAPKAPKVPTALSEVEARLAELASQEEALRAQVAALRQRRQELQLRFENDGDYVLVYGVAADQALRARATEWSQWLHMEGARKLREHLQTRKERP